jgi:hypothetical protein
MEQKRHEVEPFIQFIFRRDLNTWSPMIAERSHMSPNTLESPVQLCKHSQSASLDSQHNDVWIEVDLAEMMCAILFQLRAYPLNDWNNRVTHDRTERHLN